MYSSPSCIIILGPLPLLPTSSGPSGRASPRAGRGEKGSGDGEGMVGEESRWHGVNVRKRPTFLRLSSSPVVWSGPLLSLASHPVTTVDD